MYHLNKYRLSILSNLYRFGSAYLAFATISCLTVSVGAQAISPSGSVVRRISGEGDKLELTTNTSRILTIDKKIPRVQVNNPELLSVTPLSATQVQVSAKKAGVTQVNLWDEDGKIHTVDVYIYGDVRELEHALKTQFPNSSVRVYRYSQSLVLTGFIDRPDYVDPIYELASDYAPKVINNISVGGVQQVLLKVKVFEISRTKARQLGVDFAHVSSSGAFIGTSVSGLLSNINVADGVTSVVDTGGQTVEFAITNGADVFTGLLDALQQDNVAKILAEPNIVAVSGRPANFNEGGEIPVLIPQSLGQVAIEYKPYGTQIDFLPIVLGNGKIRLEVRPRISEIDDSRSVTVNDITIPALTVRQVDTAVEMNAGQTFAIAGLIQQRTETSRKGIPLLADIPYLGVPFRRVEDNVNEIELLILVTPELVSAMDPHEVPPCGPGMGTTSPPDCEFYMKGQIESPDNCSACRNGDNCSCQAGGFASAPPMMVNGTSSHPSAMSGCANGGCQSGSMVYHQGVNQGVSQYQGSYPTLADETMTRGVIQQPMIQQPSTPMLGSSPMPGSSTMGGPTSMAGQEELSNGFAPSMRAQPMEAQQSLPILVPQTSNSVITEEKNQAYMPQISPNYAHQASTPYQPIDRTSSHGTNNKGLIGPVGYDMD